MKKRASLVERSRSEQRLSSVALAENTDRRPKATIKRIHRKAMVIRHIVSKY